MPYRIDAVPLPCSYRTVIFPCCDRVFTVPCLFPHVFVALPQRLSWRYRPVAVQLPYRYRTLPSSCLYRTVLFTHISYRYGKSCGTVTVSSRYRSDLPPAHTIDDDSFKYQPEQFPSESYPVVYQECTFNTPRPNSSHCCISTHIIALLKYIYTHSTHLPRNIYYLVKKTLMVLLKYPHTYE